MITDRQILIGVALHVEGRALARAWGWRSLEVPYGYRSWEGSQGVIWVTGVGCARMAAGMAYAWEYLGGLKRFCLAVNIGIAGRHGIDNGLWQISKVHDLLEHREYYPDLLYQPLFSLTPLYTVSSPLSFEQIKEKSIDWGVVDMEGASFWLTLNRFLPCHRIQLLKIALDPLTPYAVQEKEVEEGVIAYASTIQKTLWTWLQIANQEVDPEHTKILAKEWVHHHLTDWHLTRTLYHQLISFLRGYIAYFGRLPETELLFNRLQYLSPINNKKKVKEAVHVLCTELRRSILASIS